MSGNKLVFLHLPKTGGSTIRYILKKMYLPSESFFINGDKDKEVFNKMSNANKIKLKLIAGHFGMNFMNMIPLPFSIFTMIRDPVERIVSYYRYVNRTPAHFQYPLLQEENMGLVEYAIGNYHKDLDNAIVRLYCSRDFPIDGCQDSDLESAKFHLKTKVDCFGVTERFDESLQMFKKVLGWAEIPVYVKINVSPEDEIVIDNQIRNSIIEKNIFDYQLYQWVLEEFNNMMRMI